MGEEKKRIRKGERRGRKKTTERELGDGGEKR
jgi:hypothetical protein